MYRRSWSQEFSSLKPFLSIFLIVSSLLLVVFLKMEERRLGYSLLKLNHEHRQLLEEKRSKSVLLAKITRPQNVERLAQKRFTLKKVQASQIIHLTGGGMPVADQKRLN